MKEFFIPIQKALIVLLLTIFLAATCGCSKESEEISILTHSPGFTMEVPKGYHLDEKLNLNDAMTSTWFREDGLALFSVDRQPLGGKRMELLQKKGKKRFLAGIVKDLKRDLGNRLEEFSRFESHQTKLAKADALLVSFVTRHEGTSYKVYLLVALQLGEPAHEVMLDFRLPLDEAKTDHTWEDLVKSWAWGEAKAAGHGDEKKSDGGH